MPQFANKLRRKQLDALLEPYKGLPELPRGYIHEIRHALGMSSQQLARRMGINRSWANEMEETERAGNITLNTLKRAADALGCRLVYGLIPSNSLEMLALSQARLKAEELSDSIVRTMSLEQQRTTMSDEEELIRELAEELLRKGGRDLWELSSEPSK